MDECKPLLGGLLICNAAFVASAVLLYRLGTTVLKDERLARGAALLYCFNPASARTDGLCSPRHLTRFEPSFPEIHFTL